MGTEGMALREASKEELQRERASLNILDLKTSETFRFHITLKVTFMIIKGSSRSWS